MDPGVLLKDSSPAITWSDANRFLPIKNCRDFWLSLVKASPSNVREGVGVGLSSMPGKRAKISQPKSQNIRAEQYCNKFNKDFKNGPHQKNL